MVLLLHMNIEDYIPTLIIERLPIIDSFFVRMNNIKIIDKHTIHWSWEYHEVYEAWYIQV